MGGIATWAGAAGGADRAWRDDHCFVVPAFGDSPFLDGCLRSLRAQGVGSRIALTTSTPSPFIARAAAAAGAELLVNPHRRGLGADFNFALAAARTRFVTLAHQDDLYAADFVRDSLALFERHPEGVLSFTGYQEIDDAGAPCWSRVSVVKHAISAVVLGRRTVVGPARGRMFLRFGDPLPCSSVTIDTHRLPGFRFRDEFSGNLDWDAWWRLACAGHSFLHAPARLVGRRHNALTTTARLKRAGIRRAEDLEMFRRIWPRPFGQAIALLYRFGY